jgi:hypothetical protein
MSRLADIGRLLYGVRWKYCLSQALCVEERVVRNWAYDDSRVPKAVWEKMLVLLDEKAQTCQKAGADLRVCHGSVKPA